MDVFSVAYSGNELALRGMLLAAPAAASSVSADRKQSLLYVAARGGHLGIVKMLVEDFHVDPNVPNASEDQSRPLHGACYGGHSDVVKFLVFKGADVSVTNAYGETPRANAKQPAASVSKAAAKACLDALTTVPQALAAIAASAAHVAIPALPLATASAPVATSSPSIIPTSPEQAALEALSLADLRKAAAAAGLPTSGTKAILVSKLISAKAAPTVAAASSSAVSASPAGPPMKQHMPEPQAAPAPLASTSSPPLPAPLTPQPAGEACIIPRLPHPFDPAWVAALRGATATQTEIPKDTEEFWNLEERVMACNQRHNEDYVTNRLKKKKLPLTFIVKRAWRVSNPVLEDAFQKTMTALTEDDKSLGRVRVAFHGTREANIDSILRTSLLRFQHPLNPCKEQADDGYFGTNKLGVYVSRYYEYTLKYSNGLTPLDEGQCAKVIMFKCLPGRSKHIEKLNMGMPPTPGFHSHSSPSYLEWYLFDERQLCPEFVVELQAKVDTRTAADDE